MPSSDVRQLPDGYGRWRKMYSVQSFSSPDTSYVVAQDAKGQWGCSCPRWTHVVPRVNCKHIKAVLSTLTRAGRIEIMTEAEIEARPALKKVISRFSLIEV